MKFISTATEKLPIVGNCINFLMFSFLISVLNLHYKVDFDYNYKLGLGNKSDLEREVTALSPLP